MSWFATTSLSDCRNDDQSERNLRPRNPQSEAFLWFRFHVPSGYVKIAIGNGPVKIVDLPSCKMVIFYSYGTVYQRVLLIEKPHVLKCMIGLAGQNINSSPQSGIWPSADHVGKTMPWITHPCGNGKHTTYKNGDLYGSWHCFTHITFIVIQYSQSTNDYPLVNIQKTIWKLPFSSLI